MSEEKKPKQHDIPARICIVIIFFILLAISGKWLLKQAYEFNNQVFTSWDSNDIHVYSGSDGPFLLTHLVAYRNGHGDAFALLPKPITITDSWGYIFKSEEISKLEWVDSKGQKQSQPLTGTKIGVMYIIPNESKH
jgi:hypothetical protein